MAVADRMLSFDGDLKEDAMPAAENAGIKACSLARQWYGLCAGETSLTDRLVLRAQQILNEIAPNDPKLRTQVEAAIRTAYDHVRNDHVESEVLKPHGLTWARYTKGIGSGEFHEISEKVEACDLNVGLLIFGVDERRFQHFFEVSRRGVITDRAQPGYSAIGIGWRDAMGMLAMRLVDRLPHADLLYRLCEVKFYTETVRDIGRPTTVFIVNSLGERSLIQPRYIEQLRDIWERERRAAPPADAIQIVEEALRHRLA